jgi:cell division protein FtsZ
MIAANITDVEFWAVNTDADVLRQSVAGNKLQIGTDGLGVGGDPKKGEQCALENIDLLKQMIDGADMVFITTGMGGGTGTGASPIIAKLAREMGVLTVAVVTKPFSFEQQKRMDYALEGIEKIKKYVDALITIPNDRIFKAVDEKTPTHEMYKMVDSIQTVTDTITKTGTINIDFADVRTILKDSGDVIIGIGEDEDLTEAIKKAISNVFVEGPDIKHATSLLINISYSNTNPLTTGDLVRFNEICKSEFKKCESIKRGEVAEKDLDTRKKVSVIASFKNEEEKVPQYTGMLFNDSEKESCEQQNEQEEEQTFNFSVPACDQNWKLKYLKK